ncbi:MAG: hypothetical protein ACXWPX_10960 [Pseudobdellovibrio sp.]
MSLSFFARCYQAVLLLFCRYFPAFFAQNVCGRLVYVSRFPVIALDYSEPAGWYFVESFIFTHNGELQIGLEIQLDSVEYYAISDLDLTAIGINFSQVVSSLKAISDFKTASTHLPLSANLKSAP